jgi:HPt (histidine-containing phosphotransfer) domain-containing protein
MDSRQFRYDIEGFAAELEVDLETVVGLFVSYIQEMKEEIGAMQGYLRESDWYMLERTIHNIKGVSANLSIQDVFEEATVFDDRLKKNMTTDAQMHVQKLIGLITDAEAEIRDFFKVKGIPL